MPRNREKVFEVDGGGRGTAKTGITCILLTLFFLAVFGYFFGCSPIGDGYLLHQPGWGKAVYLLFCFVLASGTALIICRRYRVYFEKLDRIYVKKKLRRVRERLHMDKKEAYVLLLIIVTGAVLRVSGYNWGITSIFQPDESNLVRPVLVMAMDKWPYYDYFGYPNMFVSRLAWLCLLIFSKLTDTPIDIITIEGYFLFRVIVAIFSTATIVVVFLIGNYIKAHLGLIMAGLAAVFPEYVCLSKQVTGDSTALFFTSLVLLSSLVYQDRKTSFSIFCMSAFAAMATAEKWHSAVACFYIAAVIGINSREIRNFIRQGICAFLSYIAVLSLIAPTLFWNLAGAVSGVAYMYGYDQEEEVYTWGQLFVGRIGEFLQYIGIIALIFIAVGVITLWKTRRRSYIIILLGLIKIVAICCLNRGFPRWALEFYLTILFIMALGVHSVLFCKKKVWSRAGCVGTALVIGSMLCGSCLNVVTAVASARDTRLLQDNYCDANGITVENSMYEYYTGFRPGGIKTGGNYIEDGFSEEYHNLTNMLQVDAEGMLYKTEADIDYAIDLVNQYDTNVTDLLSKQCRVVQTFYAAGPDIFGRPVTGIEKSWNEVEIIWNNCKQIRKIQSGANTGGDIIIYDISALPAK